jgi:hypothetical protein
MNLESVRFLPAPEEFIMAKSTGGELRDDYHGTYGSQLVGVKLMAVSHLAMTIRPYLFARVFILTTLYARVTLTNVSLWVKR